MTAAVLLPAEGWGVMAPRVAFLLGLAAACLIAGYLMIVVAMRVGDIGHVAPFRYVALVVAIGLGWAVFGQLPDGCQGLAGRRRRVVAGGRHAVAQRPPQRTLGAVVRPAGDDAGAAHAARIGDLELHGHVGAGGNAGNRHVAGAGGEPGQRLGGVGANRKD